MTLAQVTQLSGPVLVALLTVCGVPLTVAALRWLSTRAASIQNQTFRTLAVDAVAAVEQTLTQSPSVTKKAAAMNVLTGAGVPADTAHILVEAAVHSLQQGAVQVLATPAPPVVLVPEPPPGPVIETPAGPLSTQPH
jgi:hypothetical protein